MRAPSTDHPFGRQNMFEPLASLLHLGGGQGLLYTPTYSLVRKRQQKEVPSSEMISLTTARGGRHHT